jgi:hypothetical protein
MSPSMPVLPHAGRTVVQMLEAAARAAPQGEALPKTPAHKTDKNALRRSIP